MTSSRMQLWSAHPAAKSDRRLMIQAITLASDRHATTCMSAVSASTVESQQSRGSRTAAISPASGLGPGPPRLTRRTCWLDHEGDLRYPSPNDESGRVKGQVQSGRVAHRQSPARRSGMRGFAWLVRQRTRHRHPASARIAAAFTGLAMAISDTCSRGSPCPTQGLRNGDHHRGPLSFTRPPRDASHSSPG